MAIMLGISAAGGCHSGPAMTNQSDAFALRGESEHHSGLIGRLFRRSDSSTTVQGTVVPMDAAAGYPSTQPYTAGAMAPRTVIAPATINTLQRQPISRIAPTAAPASSSGVIASSWQQVTAAPPPVTTDQSLRRVDLQLRLPGNREPVVLYPTPPGTTVAVSGPELNVSEGPPGDTGDSGLPQPRILPPGDGAYPPLPPHGVLMNTPPHGTIAAGPEAIPPVPREFQKQALPSYVVEPPDLLLIQASEAISDPLQPIQGQHLIRPDGTISLGVNGVVRVAGLTIEQVKEAIARVLLARKPMRPKVDPDNPKKITRTTVPYTLEDIIRELDVDVLAYNSKFFYVITDGGGYGAQITRHPITGNETVLDALAQVNGLPPVASKKRVWLARATQDPDHPKVMPVDYCALVTRGSALTNYQIYPGDRVYVGADPLINLDTRMSKLFSPIQRALGLTLLGSSTVNSIRNSNTSGNPGGTGR
jgi:polysaccharide export outer membrane protein